MLQIHVPVASRNTPLKSRYLMGHRPPPAPKRQCYGPLISVIIPAYECHDFLHDAVSSALGQTFRNVEVVVVSDDLTDYEPGLPDDTRLMFCSTGVRGGGPSLARNTGFYYSSGTYVVFLDADDIMYPHRLNILLPLAEQYGAAQDNTAFIEQPGGARLGQLFEASCPEFATLDSLMQMTRQLRSPLIQRKLSPLWDNDITFSEDILFNFHLMQAVSRLPVVNLPLMEYRVREGSVSHSDNSHLKAEANYTRILSKLEGCADEGADSLRKLIRRWQALNREYSAAFEKGHARHFSEFERTLPNNLPGCAK